jgi:hypothetical protein
VRPGPESRDYLQAGRRLRARDELRADHAPLGECSPIRSRLQDQFRFLLVNAGHGNGTGKSAAVQRRNPRRRLSGSRAIRARESPDQTSNWTLIARQGRSTISIPNPGQAWRKVPGSTTACLRIARSVPSGMSPGWFGTVVYRFVLALYQIS